MHRYDKRTKWHKKSAVLCGLKRTSQVVGRFVRKSHRLLVRGAAIRAYLERHSVRKLQIGSGPNLLPGWLSTDLCDSTRLKAVYMNAAKPFPLPSQSFDYVFSEHMIEHLPYEQGLAMLRECFRVLKPAGRIRIATPRLEALIGLYRPNRSEIQRRYIQWIGERHLIAGQDQPAFVINNGFRNWGHQFIYDCQTLQQTLENAGFVDVVLCQPGVSGDEHLRGIERHGQVIGDEEINQYETMVLEALCPPVALVRQAA